MKKMDKKMDKAKEDIVKVSSSEREILREIIKSEKANVQVFNLPNKQEQVRYEKVLERLDGKFA
jgi:hypothetical protein